MRCSAGIRATAREPWCASHPPRPVVATAGRRHPSASPYQSTDGTTFSLPPGPPPPLAWAAHQQGVADSGRAQRRALHVQCPCYRPTLSFPYHPLRPAVAAAGTRLSVSRPPALQHPALLSLPPEPPRSRRRQGRLPRHRRCRWRRPPRRRRRRRRRACPSPCPPPASPGMTARPPAPPPRSARLSSVGQ